LLPLGCVYPIHYLTRVKSRGMLSPREEFPIDRSPDRPLKLARGLGGYTHRVHSCTPSAREVRQSPSMPTAIAQCLRDHRPQAPERRQPKLDSSPAPIRPNTQAGNRCLEQRSTHWASEAPAGIDIPRHQSVQRTRGAVLHSLDMVTQPT